MPLAVCGSQEDRHGIVLTANYLAKPRGVRVWQAIWQAKQVRPELNTDCLVHKFGKMGIVLNIVLKTFALGQDRTPVTKTDHIPTQSGHVRRSAARQHQLTRRSHRPPGRFLWKMMMDREKKYVPVLVRFDAEGKMRPVEIEFEEGQVFAVDRILDVRQAACQSVGGVGDRYTCRILGKETYLWFEKGRWFVAAKI